LEVKAGLLELAVRMGLLTLRELMEAEVTRLCGPKGKHLKENRRANRHGAEKGSVVLGGRKVSVERPRVRTVDGREVPLETYRTFQDGEVLTEMALERMLHGRSCRRYRHGLEPVGE